jgi:hypothetical protein
MGPGACQGFLLDRWGGWEENGDMSFSRALGVTAIVMMTASLVAACGDDEPGASGFSNGTDGSGSGSGGSASASSSGGGPTTTEGPTSSTGSTTSAESSRARARARARRARRAPRTRARRTRRRASSTTSPASCGNGIIDGTEQCDGADLNDFTCEALGNAGGTLQCDPVTCTFDTQLCEGGGGTSG